MVFIRKYRNYIPRSDLQDSGPMRHCIVKTMLFATENKNAPCCDCADPVQQGNITRGMRLHMFQVTLTLPRIMPRQNSLPYYGKLVLMQSQPAIASKPVYLTLQNSAAASGRIEPVPVIPFRNPDPPLLHSAGGLVEVVPRVIVTI